MAELRQFWIHFWPHLVGAGITLITLVASVHVILHKRDTRAATAWMGIIWIAPILGSLLYVLLGINRIERKANRMRPTERTTPTPTWKEVCPPELLQETVGAHAPHLKELVRAVGEITSWPLLAGNRCEPLFDGVEAYPQMLEAIENARHSVSLCSYIFNDDTTGHLFVEALGRAVQRGVQVRVLIDNIGANYKWPTVVPALRKAKVPVARFMRTLMPAWFAYANLRSHRKILVADGRVGFTGGLNIREPEDLRVSKRSSIHDLHFRLEGPVVAHLQYCFAEDWEFTTGERLDGERWFPPLEPCGPILARGIIDGPDEDLDKFRLTLLGALASAERSVRIMTPYFLPDESLVSAINVVAMRGVEVDIVLPEIGNLAMVQWASTAQLWQVLERGPRVWLTPPPFDHTKLMLVDGEWTLLGSGNWDPRSLRLNFEFNVEAYDSELWARLNRHVEERLARSRRVTLADVNNRPLPIKLRDGLARLFSPYL